MFDILFRIPSFPPVWFAANPHKGRLFFFIFQSFCSNKMNIVTEEIAIVSTPNEVFQASLIGNFCSRTPSILPQGQKSVY